MPKPSPKRGSLYRFSVGSDFGVTGRDRDDVSSGLASLMSQWGTSAAVRLKGQHTIAVSVCSPLTQEQLRLLGSQLERERNRIENAHLSEGFDMRDEQGNVIRIGPER